MTPGIRKIASAVRWRLKINRWAVKVFNAILDAPQRLTYSPSPQMASPLLGAMRSAGYVHLVGKLRVPTIDLSQHAGKALGKPFVNIADQHWDAVVTAFMDLMEEPGVADAVNGYFDGRPFLWNVALNYSDPSQEVTDSQLWHFDYGDVRQLHVTLYFSDVDSQSGPFTFLPLELSEIIRRSPFMIERMTDQDLADQYGIDAQESAVRLIGERGDVYFNDPGRLMHQGARCCKPRLVMFVTFTSPSPMSRGGRKTISTEDRARIAAAYRARQPKGRLAPSVFGSGLK